jgi:TolB-like protein
LGQAVETRTDVDGGLSRLIAIVESLRQRHVFRVAAAYAVAAWLVIQVIDIVGPAFDVPEWVLRAAVLVSVLGFLALLALFPLVVSKRRAAGRRAGRLITILALVVAVLGAATILSWRTIIASNETQIAVLPFADLSPGRDKSYLAEGVSEQILSSLGKVPDLKVVGRSTAAAIKEEAAEPAELRKRLGITHILEGSVRSAGQDLRLSVRLIRTDDGTEQWSEDFDGRTDDIFGFQDRVAKVVAARLSTGRPQATAEAALTSADAYNLYLAARQIARNRTEPELKRAYAIAHRLVREKPDYAPGLSLLAELSFLLSDSTDSYGSIPAARARSVGRKLAERAIALAPQDAHGYAAMGLLSTGQEALDMLDEAISRDPARSELYVWKALEYDNEGRYAEAIPTLRKAADIDPLWLAAVNRLIIDLSAAGLGKEATQAVDQFEARGGDKAAVGRMRTNIAHLTGDLSGVVRNGTKTLRDNPATPYVPRYVAKARAFMGLPPDPAVMQKVDDEFPRLLWLQGISAVAAAPHAGADIWQMPSVSYYVFALGAKRDWATLVSLYDQRSDKEIFCNVNENLGPVLVPALHAAGRTQDAQRLLACLTSAFARIRSYGPRYFEIVDGAQVAALRGDEERAFALLDQAVATGWSGLSPRLTDYPALDPLMRSPRYAAVQASLDSWIARERREFEAGR